MFTNLFLCRTEINLLFKTIPPLLASSFDGALLDIVVLQFVPTHLPSYVRTSILYYNLF